MINSSNGYKMSSSSSFLILLLLFEDVLIYWRTNEEASRTLGISFHSTFFYTTCSFTLLISFSFFAFFQWMNFPFYGFINKFIAMKQLWEKFFTYSVFGVYRTYLKHTEKNYRRGRNCCVYLLIVISHIRNIS